MVILVSRNDNARFSAVPSVDISRSRFDRNSRLLTTFSAGDLIPIYIDEVLPGDTVTMDTAELVRMSTPIFPTMDNAYLDTYYFFVPNRLVWDHWRELNGQNSASYWTQNVEYTVPQVTASEGWEKGTIADYMGIPINQRGMSISVLPFRAYCLIWNEFFRDQNYMEPAYFTTNDVNSEYQGIDPEDRWDGIKTASLGGMPLPVAKYHDYFTSVLPAPQKGEPVSIPVFGNTTAIPVDTMSETHTVSNYPMHVTGVTATATGGGLGVGASNMIKVATQDGIQYASGTPRFDNLWAMVDNISVGTITELRQAFQIQKLLERDARGGTRYTEILQAHFGVTSPDSRLQRPEYLGGKRVPINIDQVLQTSATNEVSPQGNTAAFSLTTDVSSSFTKSFVEHGFIIGLCCVRTDHTYQQGLDKMWTRKRRFDYYWPELANISEQPVYLSEIFAHAPHGSGIDNSVFGYQEAWADYRYKPSRVSGAFRSQYAQSLDSWHYADYFDANNPIGTVATRDFIAETRVNIDRTLAVTSDLEDQFLANFAFRSTWTRPMPLYSVPGLSDHH